MQLGVDAIGVSVVFLCHDGNGRFVMAKRSTQARDEHGRWDCGGGKHELHVPVEELLRREIMEEYCTEVIEHEFLGFRDVHRIHQDQPTHWIALDFKVRVNPATVAIGEPHKFDAIDWFTLDTLPKEEELHSQLPYFFQKYRDRL